MTDENAAFASVSRPIKAPAESLFAVLADPARHPAIDGAGMYHPNRISGHGQGD